MIINRIDEILDMLMEEVRAKEAGFCEALQRLRYSERIKLIEYFHIRGLLHSQAPLKYTKNKHYPYWFPRPGSIGWISQRKEFIQKIKNQIKELERYQNHE